MPLLANNPLQTQHHSSSTCPRTTSRRASPSAARRSKTRCASSAFAAGRSGGWACCARCGGASRRSRRARMMAGTLTAAAAARRRRRPRASRLSRGSGAPLFSTSCLLRTLPNNPAPLTPSLRPLMLPLLPPPPIVNKRKTHSALERAVRRDPNFDAVTPDVESLRQVRGERIPLVWQRESSGSGGNKATPWVGDRNFCFLIRDGASSPPPLPFKLPPIQKQTPGVLLP